MKSIFSFNNNEYIEDEDVVQRFGLRGRNLMELAVLGIPILPGFILTEQFLSEADSNSSAVYKDALSKMGAVLGKQWNHENPLLIKLVVSPMLNMVYTFSSIHNVGLCDTTLASFAEFVGDEFAYHEYIWLLRHIMSLELQTVSSAARKAKLLRKIDEIKKAKTLLQIKKLIEDARGMYPAAVFSDATNQFMFIMDLMHKYFDRSETLTDSAILVQAMTFGNYGKESFFGTYTTRNPQTGEDVLTGEFIQNEFDTSQAMGQSIAHLPRKYLKILHSISKQLETTHKEIRRIKFTIENGKLWIIDQNSVHDKTAIAEIRTVLDLLKEGEIDEIYAINSIQTSRISEILHPVLDAKSSVTIASETGGICGAIGAAVGKVYFSTDALLEASRMNAVRNGKDTFILAMTSTYAEDVKAIEAATGVISAEGGYASHAPVVARSLGKVAMVRPDIKFIGKSLRIGGKTIREGDYISIDVPSSGKPTVYFEKLPLIEPDIDKGGLLDFLAIVQKYIGDFDVHANADQKKEAELALKFLADGIGLCRTEHMFFHDSRISIFRSLIIANDKSERKKILAKLKKMQKSDFYELFQVMQDRPVTIRLLDAPLHEFLPHNKQAMDDFIRMYRKDHPEATDGYIRNQCDMQQESNPMLGHRGVRMAISYPEIYQMQIEAIFEAAFKLRKEKKIFCKPEIMIPIVMNPSEVKTIRYGKRIEGFEIIGVKQIEKDLCKRLGEVPISYKVGTMIELPAAALLADKMAAYADFFSFGTNDLTQTCLGLSRDDFNAFFTNYNEYDLFEKNPFQILQAPVKELIKLAIERGKLARPDLTCGLCGEHGAEPENILFSMDAGLNYVSCQPYGVPVAKLTIAQANIKKLQSKQQ